MRARAPHAGPARPQAGQALVEAVVALLVLVPVFTASYLLWAWQDARHAALVAARFVAFDAALRGAAASGVPAREALRQHVLDGRRRGWWSLGRRPAALVDESAVQVQLSPWALPEPLQRTESAAFTLLAPARALGSGALDLQRGGGIRAQVVLPAAPVTFPVRFERLERIEGPRLTASLALLADPWRAGSAQRSQTRVESLSVAGRTREWVEPLRGVRAALALVEPAFERLCLGRIDVEIVPPDRLAGSSAGLSDLRLNPCL